MVYQPKLGVAVACHGTGGRGMGCNVYALGDGRAPDFIAFHGEEGKMEMEGETKILREHW